MKKPQFTLSRKNQKGQVAIFVALIFQVIFVFFALLINVGLLVHHKINLQQSTDLAAYYGAMKQAESLNAMAHVNFQIRQAWKLLTWRYRVLGTFGMQHSNASTQPMFPIELIGNTGKAEVPALTNFQANSCGGANTADTPFFCIGHGGMFGWKSNIENVCKVDCPVLNGVGFQVNGVTATPQSNIGGGTAASLFSTLTNINTNLNQLCNSLAGANMQMLAQFIVAYQQEMSARTQTMTMLAGNLTNPASDFVDLDGKKVVDGVEKTLKNNLTEANNDSTEFKARYYNSLSDDKCKIDKSSPANKYNGGQAELIKRIEFNFVNFYIHSCILSGASGSGKYNAGSIFNASLSALADGSPVGGGQPVNVQNIIPAALEAEILKLIGNNNEKFTVGFEKNPWCPAYFVVQSTTKPRIPFLPLVEIKLNAVSVAKPFGGSMGPWFSKTWNNGLTNTQDQVAFTETTKQADELLPSANLISGPALTLKDSNRLLPNFSRFVGDTQGVSDPYYLSQYHGALINKRPNPGSSLFGGDFASVSGQQQLSLVPTMGSDLLPALNSWSKALDFTDADYDPIVGGFGNKDSFLRSLEISVVAPNQFDLTYYSIDPDYYNNYYKRLSDRTIFNKIKSAAGLGPKDETFIRPDFGFNPKIYKQSPEFSVRNQIEIVKKVFADSGFNIGLNGPGGSAPFINTFPELAKQQSSLLTGWTFKNFTNFDDFPGDELSPTQNMNFARCSDKWQGTSGSPDYKIPKDINPQDPSTPGNCVTGGRVGYSVKLVAPSTLSKTVSQTLGGPGSTPGPILNAIPSEYLNNFP